MRETEDSRTTDRTSLIYGKYSHIGLEQVFSLNRNDTIDGIADQKLAMTD